MSWIDYNGAWREQTPEEAKEAEQMKNQMEAAERHRPLRMDEITHLIIAQNIQALAVDDATAVRMRDYYPTWESMIGKTAKKAGFKFSHNGELYATNQANHTFQRQWEPGQGTESIYRLIPEQYAGDVYDPIPYKGNLALEKGKIYVEGGVLYECIEDTIVPVYDSLAKMTRYVKIYGGD